MCASFVGDHGGEKEGQAEAMSWTHDRRLSEGARIVATIGPDRDNWVNTLGFPKPKKFEDWVDETNRLSTNQSEFDKNSENLVSMGYWGKAPIKPLEVEY